MDGVCLLSEISPLGTAHFNPLRQAADWHGLVRTEEICDLSDQEAFRDAIRQIRRRANQRGLTLLIRDWSHLDWVGFPFVEPTMQSSWCGIDGTGTSDGSSQNGAGWLGP